MLNLRDNSTPTRQAGHLWVATLVALAMMSLLPGRSWAEPEPSADVTTGPTTTEGADPKFDIREYSPDRYGALQALKDTVDRLPDNYAGLSNKGDTAGPQTAGVHLVEGGIIDSDTQTAIDYAKSMGIVVTVDTQKYSTTELQAIMAKVPTLFGKDLSSWGINPDYNQVQVEVVGATAEAEALGRNAYGDAIKVGPGAFATNLNALPRPAIDPYESLASRIAAYGRYNDTPEFYGGDYIVRSAGNNLNGVCSSGFTLTNFYGQRYSITAGHCGTVGQAWRTGGAPGIQYGDYLQGFGTMQFNHFFDSGSSHLDAALIARQPTPNYTGRIWYGPPNTPNWIPVSTTEESCNGCQVWVSGAVSGDKLATLTGYPSCESNSPNYIAVCGVQRVNDTSGAACQGGDSGGPVYSHIGNGYARAHGIIVARFSAGQCSYTLTQTILNHWTSTLTVTG